MAFPTGLSHSVKILGASAIFLTAAGIGAATANGSDNDRAPNPPGPYPVNAKGETFGKMPFDGAADQVPDMVAVVGVHGKTGYARADEMGLDDEPSSPEEALRQQAASQDREIPVYAEDGVTVVDTFIVEGASEEMPPPPSFED